MNLGLVGGINPEVSSSAKAEAGNSWRELEAPTFAGLQASGIKSCVAAKYL